MSRPVGPPGTRTRSRGRMIAVAVWLIVFLLVAITTLVHAVDYWSRPADQHVPAAGGTVTITAPDEYAVYLEGDGSVSAPSGSGPVMTGPSGAPVPVRTSNTSETYSVDERAGVRIGTFTATEPGTYTIAGYATAASGDELVISSRTVGSLLGVVFGLVGTGVLLVLGFVGGLLMLVLGRRRPDPPWGPPWGTPPGPPPGGSGPPPRR